MTKEERDMVMASLKAEDDKIKTREGFETRLQDLIGRHCDDKDYTNMVIFVDNTKERGLHCLLFYDTEPSTNLLTRAARAMGILKKPKKERSA